MNIVSFGIRSAAAACAAFCSALAVAAAALPTPAHIIQVRVDADGRGMMSFDQPFVGSPATCGQNSGNKNSLAFNATTGKAALAFALSAKATGAPVVVYGTGACAVYGDFVEDFSYGAIQQ